MYFAALWLIFSAACSVLAFRRHPLYGLLFYLATLYMHPPSRWWGAMLPDPGWAAVAAGVTALAIILHRGRLNPKPLWCANAPAVLLILYTVWMFIQTPWALDLESHMLGSVRYAKYLVAFWFVYRIADTKQNLLAVLYAHGAGCGLLGIYARYTPREQGRLDGVGGPGIDDANTLAMYFATGAIVCMGLILTQKGWRRWIAFVLLALIGNGFVLANSRGAFMGLVAGVLVMLLCKSREHRRMFWALSLVGLVGFAIIVDKLFIERMFTIGDVVEASEDADMSARSRMVIYEAQLKMFAEYPFGSGYRGTVELSPRFIDRQWLTVGKDGDESSAARASHNTFMTTLVEQGVPGAVLFLWLFGWVCLSVPRIRRNAANRVDPDLATLAGAACGALMVVFVAGMATDYLMAEVQFWLYALLVSALQLSQADLLARRPVAVPVAGALKLA